MKIGLELTPEEEKYLLSSGFGGLSDALCYHAENGDLRVLTIVDKIADKLIDKIDIHWVLYFLIKYYKDDLELVENLMKKDKHYTDKYNLRYDDSLRA